MSNVGIQPLLTATYVSSKGAEKLLKSLTKEAGFSAENVVARLAIARSLQEGELLLTEEASEAGGKQIRGSTLLGRRETAATLVGMISLAQSHPPTLDTLKDLVRRHWERGLELIESDRQATGDLDAVFLTYLSSAVAEDIKGHQLEPGVLQDEIVGQHDVVKVLISHASARAGSEDLWLGTIALVGEDGCGKSHLAATLGAALGLPYVEVEITPGENPRKAVSARCRRQKITVSPSGQLSAVVGISASSSNSAQVQQLAGERSFLTKGAVCLMSRDEQDIEADLTLKLHSYTRDEVAEILHRRVGGWPLEVRRLLSLAGGLNPGISKTRALEYRNLLREKGSGRPNENSLLSVMADEWGIDRLGLGPKDYEYLRALRDTVDPPAVPNHGLLMGLGLISMKKGMTTLTSRGEEAVNAQEGT